MSVRILAFAGRQRSGKDTAIAGLKGGSRITRTLQSVAREDGLAEAVRFGSVVRVAWADALKRASREWYGLTEDQIEGALKETVDERWGKSPREIMRLLGTEVGRSIHPETWTRWLMEREIPREVRRARTELFTLVSHFGASVDAERQPILVCVSGTRFPNEAEATHRAGGRVVRVVRRGLALDDSHESEQLIDRLSVDGEVVNDGTPAQLAEKVRALVDTWWPSA